MIIIAVLFLGNGLNQLEQIAPSWNALLDQISTESRVILHDSLSMTLGYEAFEAEVCKKKSISEAEKLKEKIAKGLQEGTEISFPGKYKGKYYKKLFDTGIRQILTTNYDYYIERYIDKNFEPQWTTREILYSRKRVQTVQDFKVYHVHGECKYPDSICLGFEHYAGSLEKMRTELTHSTKSDDNPNGTYMLEDVMKGLKKPDGHWAYKFFLEDVYFVGFSADVSEIDIWWLIAYRDKLMREKKLNITNKIYYFETEYGKSKEAQVALKRKQQLLETFGVRYETCEGKGYAKRYEQAIRSIQVLEGKKKL